METLELYCKLNFLAAIGTGVIHFKSDLTVCGFSVQRKTSTVIMELKLANPQTINDYHRNFPQMLNFKKK